MSGKTDVVKGRLKEAVGALTGNDKLRAEADEAIGKVNKSPRRPSKRSKRP